MVSPLASESALTSLPSVFAFKRCVMVSDGVFEYEDTAGRLRPLPVLRHGAVGTQNVNEEAAADSKKTTASKGERDPRNVIVTETAKTGPDMELVHVTFALKPLPLSQSLYSCSSGSKESKENDLKAKRFVTDFIERAINSSAVDLVAQRLARNICNGRWLWRNRLIADRIRMVIKSPQQEWQIADALQLPLNDFENYSLVEEELGALMAQSFKGQESKLTLQIHAIIDFGMSGSIEVFPSQNFEVKGRYNNNISRSLYKIPLSDATNPLVVGQAALRDAKIWNALRTIDTWYRAFSDTQRAIAIEPQGASISEVEFFREGEQSVFKLFKQLNRIDPLSPEGQYCIASLIRGGVFSESAK